MLAVNEISPVPHRVYTILLEPVSDDDDKPSFLNGALALKSNLPFGCDKLHMADKSLMHKRTHDRFDVWIASSTPDSRNQSPPPTYKLLRLMTPGAEVDKVVFQQLDVRDNQYAIHVHNDLINGLLGSIGLNSDEVHLLLGTNPRNSKLFFAELNEEQVNTVVSQLGSKPRFQIQPVEWYRGAHLTNMVAVFEVRIKKTHKETWWPMLYASVLGMFWMISSVLQAQSPVKIHVLGPSKLPLGLTETGHSLLKTRYHEPVAAIGAVFKDLNTGQFLDTDIISKPTVPSTWKKELVGTVYILDVAPWWYLSDLTEALAPSVQCRYIADRVRWSVGEMRTATWRLTGESVSQLIGKVYLSDSGMPPMSVISEADYEARKKRITDRPRNTGDTTTRKQGLITADEMARAMELDDQVDKVISSLKRRHYLHLGGAVALRRPTKSLRRLKAPYGDLRRRGAGIRALTARAPPPQNNKPPAGFEPLLSPIAGDCAKEAPPPQNGQSPARFEPTLSPIAGNCADCSTNQAAGNCMFEFHRGWTSQKKNFKKSDRRECTDSPLSNVQRPNHLDFHCKTCMQRYRVTDE